MKKLLLASVAFAALFAGPAIAADMAVRRPVQVINNWTGFYAGLTAGAGWSRSEVDLVGSPVAAGPVATNAQVAAIPPVLATNPGGALIGGQIGYNYQMGAWVAGLEADLSWADLDGSSIPQYGAATVVGNSISASASADQRLRYFGTVRGRLGFLATDSLLLFATSGLAYGQVHSSAGLTEANNSGTSITPGAGSASTTRAGWTVGGGLEYLFADHWTVKAEYLYFNLGSVSYGLTPLVGTAAGVPFTTVGAAASTTDFSGSIIRVGLNYKFGYDAVIR